MVNIFFSNCGRAVFKGGEGGKREQKRGKPRKKMRFFF
jgi:hypothetical protein